MLMKGTFRDDPLDLEDKFPSGKYQGRRVIEVLASDLGLMLLWIRNEAWHFTDAVKKLAKESV
jgi:hypothetical protein